MFEAVMHYLLAEETVFYKNTLEIAVLLEFLLYCLLFGKEKED